MNPVLRTQDRALHELRLAAGTELVVVVQIAESSSYSSVELMSLDGDAPVYFCWAEPAQLRGAHMDVFPAVVGTVQIVVPGYGSRGVATAELHLISEGTPLVSIIRR